MQVSSSFDWLLIGLFVECCDTSIETKVRIIAKRIKTLTNVRYPYKTIHSQMFGINNSLTRKKWINIDLDACQHIQAEIIRDIEKVMDSSEFDKYFALMNQKTMRIVRNAFYAKRGYKFEDPELQKHFMNYAWYKPTEKVDLILTPEENHRVNLLKSIEDKWVIRRYEDDWENPQPPLLPNGVKIITKGEKSLIKFRGHKTLDVTPKTYGESSSRRDFFTVHGNTSQDTILVCSHVRMGDSRFLEEMNLYSVDGNLLHGYVNNNSKDWINGLYRCPEWSSEKSNILISYNNAGCCGATWDILATFDAKLKPIAVLNCSEGACGETNFFSEINEGSRLVSVSAEGGFDNTLWNSKSAKQYINYDQAWSVSVGDKYYNTW